MEQGCPLSLPECHALKSLSLPLNNFFKNLLVSFVYILNVLYILVLCNLNIYMGQFMRKCRFAYIYNNVIKMRLV